MPAEDWQLVSVGKAALEMAHGAQLAWGARLARGLVVSPDPPVALPPFQVLQAGHPRLDDRSLLAGAALEHLVREPVPTLFLWSGGGSALVEVLPEGTESRRWMEEWEQLYRAGLSILQMNARRAAFSRIKGGQLLDLLRAPSLSLIWSDVLQGPEWVASGPTYRRNQPAQHAWEMLADGHTLRDIFGSRLANAGYRVRIQPDLLHSVAEGLDIVRGWRPDPGEAFLACAEMTLEVKGDGRGGRCQHFALEYLQGLRSSPHVLLAAASDGIDGLSPAAGACVGASMDAERAEDYLNRYASYEFFQRAGCSWEPGPTGNNLNDLVVLLHPFRQPPSALAPFGTRKSRDNRR